jgi:hypothetical protein
MLPSSTNEITQLLLAWSNGDRTALEELTPLVYAELYRLDTVGECASRTREITSNAMLHKRWRQAL